MSVTGTAESGPVRVGVAIGDLTSGMWTAIALLAALRARETSGRGQKVELSLLGSLVSLLSVQGQRYLSLKEVPQRSGNEHPVIAPYGVFHAKDGEFSIAPATPEMWISLCAVLGLEELTADPRFVDNATRATHRMVLKDIIDAKLKARTRSDWMTRLQKVGIPCGPINSIADVLEDEQVRQSGLIDSIVHPQLGKLELLASPIQMAGLESGSTRMPPPRFGEHTEQILMALGHTDVEVKGLLDQGVVFQLALETMEAS
jgi:formyl-CoA transferase